MINFSRRSKVHLSVYQWAAAYSLKSITLDVIFMKKLLDLDSRKKEYEKFLIIGVIRVNSLRMKGEKKENDIEREEKRKKEKKKTQQM